MKQLHYFKIILNKLETQDQVLPIYLKTGTQPDRQKDKQALSISNSSMSGPELTLHPRPQENRRNCPTRGIVTFLMQFTLTMLSKGRRAGLQTKQHCEGCSFPNKMSVNFEGVF